MLKFIIIIFLISTIGALTFKKAFFSFIEKSCVYINNKTTQNLFKLITGFIAMLALIISMETFQKSVIFGNRPIPKIVLNKTSNGDINIDIKNFGKNPVTNMKLLSKFVPLKGDDPLEDKAKINHACSGIIESNEPQSFPICNIKDLTPEAGYIFFFIFLNSNALYKEKTIYEVYYYESSKEKLWRLNENWGALGAKQREYVKKQIEMLKKDIKAIPYPESCQDN